MSKFKIGDKVRIRRDSEYYGMDSICNPRHEDGIIIEMVNTDYIYTVQWENDLNFYRTQDLEPSQAWYNEQRIKKELGIE